MHVAIISTFLASAVGAASDVPMIRQLIERTPQISVPTDPVEDVITPRHATGFTGSGNTREELFEESKRLTKPLEEIIAFNPNSDVLFPCSLVQGNSLPGGTLNPIRATRKPVTVTVNDLVGVGGGSFSKRVTDPTLANIRDAINSILNQRLTRQQPARFTYTKTTMNSVEEGFLRLGASFNWVTGHVNGSFQTTSSHTKSRFVVRFVQQYYSVACETPANPVAFFADQQRLADLTNVIGPGNPPTYIASVTFGRELWFVIESASSVNDMQATLDAAFNGAFAGGSINLTDAQKQMLSQSTIQVLAIGGGGDSAIKLVSGDKTSQISNFLSAGANYSRTSPGAIISYTIRYLLNNNVAKVSSSSNFTVHTGEARPVPPIVITKGLFRFHTGSDDKDDNNHVAFRFTLDNNIVLNENGDVPPKQPNDDDATWHDHKYVPDSADGRTYFQVPFSNSSINTDEHHTISVTVSKTGDAHWHFGFAFKVVASDGTEYLLADTDENTNNFGGDKNSDTWSYQLPRR